jgi:hypothetical protein
MNLSIIFVFCNESLPKNTVRFDGKPCGDIVGEKLAKRQGHHALREHWEKILKPGQRELL